MVRIKRTITISKELDDIIKQMVENDFKKAISSVGNINSRRARRILNEINYSVYIEKLARKGYRALRSGF